MRLPRFAAVLAATLLTAAPALHAQQTTDPLMPRSGSWGAEAVYGGNLSATLLRFSSPTAAWLAGLSFNVLRQTDNVSGAAGNSQSYNLGSVDARLGRRWWKGGTGERVRPLSGLGLLGGLSTGSGLQAWTAGGYGELGGSYFFSPHVSLGATGEVVAGYIHDRFASPIPPDRTSTRWFVRGNLVRIAASVYF
jgi:hypothetical protein